MMTKCGLTGTPVKLEFLLWMGLDGPGWAWSLVADVGTQQSGVALKHSIHCLPSRRLGWSGLSITDFSRAFIF